MEVKVRKLHPDAKLPSLATIGSGCYDVCAIKEEVICKKDNWAHGDVYKVGIGLSFEVPMGYLLEIRPRSGLSQNGLTIVNSPGTLDSDYRGELFILLYNLSGRDVEVKKGDKMHR